MLTSGGSSGIGPGKFGIWNKTDGRWDMVIDPSGSIGFGTTTPARKVHINDVMRLQPRATAPSSPAQGDIYFDSTDNKLKVYDGSVWQECW